MYNINMTKRVQTKKVKVGSITIGGSNNVVIQSMTTTKTSDISTTLKQINELIKYGCEIVRVAIFDQQDIDALKIIVKESKIPIIADIHYNYEFAIAAINNGVSKIRINPGNICDVDELKLIVDAAKARNVAIRIGINGGSFSFDDKTKISKQMVKSACKYIKLFELWDFYNIVVSLKHSNYQIANEAYFLAAKKIKYPLHLGITEAGDLINATIKSTLGLQSLLSSNIGDTIRISINGDPVNEIVVAKKLLKQLNILKNYYDIIACPLCGRNQYNTTEWVNEIDQYMQINPFKIIIGVMGCNVNGPGEAKLCDIALCNNSKTNSTIYVDKKIFKVIDNAKAMSELKKAIEFKRKQVGNQ